MEYRGKPLKREKASAKATLIECEFSIFWFSEEHQQHGQEEKENGGVKLTGSGDKATLFRILKKRERRKTQLTFFCPVF